VPVGYRYELRTTSASPRASRWCPSRPRASCWSPVASSQPPISPGRRRRGGPRHRHPVRRGRPQQRRAHHWLL